MTKTTNYQLNQWAKSDRIMMDDFNSDNQKIDAALKAAFDSTRIVHGSYVGDGTTDRVVPLEFAPKFMILMGHIYDKSILAILTAEVFAYSGGGESFVGAAGSSEYAPYLKGETLQLRHASWGNKTGKTVYYILVG